jgi:hypothetical protein
MFSKLGMMTLGKLRGIGYKLGLVKFKIEDIDLAEIPQVSLPKEYESWHPGEEKEEQNIEDVSIDFKGKADRYVKKGVF